MNPDPEAYRKYIASPHWRSTRARILRLRGRRCERCGKTWAPGYKDNLQVHHKTYQRMGQEADQDLEVVCSPCHEMADLERAKASEERSVYALYEARLYGWAKKVYGHTYITESMQAEFNRWSELKDEERD